MSADVWLKRDVANALLATYQSMRETAVVVGGEDPARMAAFHAGYRAAISTVALFFGIEPGQVLPETRSTYVNAASSASRCGQ